MGILEIPQVKVPSLVQYVAKGLVKRVILRHMKDSTLGKSRLSVEFVTKALI